MQHKVKLISLHRVIRKASNPVFTLSLGLLSPPYPLFQWYPQSKDILLNLCMKCWNLAFDAQGLRLIIVIVQLGAVKIYVASSSGGPQEKGKTGWNSVYHQNWWFCEFHPPWMLMYFFAGFFLISARRLIWVYQSTAGDLPVLFRLVFFSSYQIQFAQK